MAKTVLLVAALALLAPRAVAADELAADGACAEAVARAVQSHYESVQDWSARFVQTREAAAFGGGIAPMPEPPREGTVVLAKPGRMRWSYETPDPSLLVTDGQVVWTYDPLLEEAQRLPDAGGLLSGAAVQFLMGRGDLLGSFRISAADCAARPVRLTLVPREDAGYERLALEVEPDSGRVLASSVTDLFGNRTRVAFSDVRTNTSPDPKLFHFEPPEGVEVIDLAVPGGAQDGASGRR